MILARILSLLFGIGLRVHFKAIKYTKISVFNWNARLTRAMKKLMKTQQHPQIRSTREVDSDEETDRIRDTIVIR